MVIETVSVRDAEPAAGSAESRTLTVNVDVPVAAGVPVMAPVGDSDRPVGSEPAVSAQLYGGTPPLAASEAE